ncbi:MAG: hypothetical protein KC656_02795 [Myxococcales bacterium]|nr:hypothetical protein [Myxococcales bacterium]
MSLALAADVPDTHTRVDVALLPGIWQVAPRQGASAPWPRASGDLALDAHGRRWLAGAWLGGQRVPESTTARLGAQVGVLTVARPHLQHEVAVGVGWHTDVQRKIGPALSTTLRWQPGEAPVQLVVRARAQISPVAEPTMAWTEPTLPASAWAGSGVQVGIGIPLS